jgi:hypothetical protein
MWFVAMHMMTPDICHAVAQLTLEKRRSFVSEINGPENRVLLPTEVADAVAVFLQGTVAYHGTEQTLVRQSPVS